MYLVYTDETGTNFSQNASPWLLYGGLVVHESKVNILEAQLQNMIARFLKLDDVKRVELHTSEIFNIIFNPNFQCKKRKRKDQENCEQLIERFQGVSVDAFIQFSDELIQFLIKMDVPLIVSIINKNDPVHEEHFINREVSALAYAFKLFLSVLDNLLAKKNEMGLLVADDFSNQIKADIKSLPLYERLSDTNIQKYKELVFLRVLHESLDWKNTSYEFKDTVAPMKYEFESKNLFLIDNINYTNSKDSILNQVSDFLLYILRKILEIDSSNDREIISFREKLKSSIRFSESSSTLLSAKLSPDRDTLFTSCALGCESPFYVNEKVINEGGTGKTTAALTTATPDP